MGGGTGVAAHPVAQLTEQVIPTCSLTQHPHRSHPPRTHSFHTIYDQNGNVTQDAEGKRFAYDAENHQKEFFSASNPGTTPDATYSYDGDGRRIKKVTAAETTVFVYNASGQLVAEYSTQISQTPQVSYLTTDHLGSPRVVSDHLGAVKDRKDYSAFGEETISAQRQSALGYTAAGDELRKGYTGYEKDNESGLDFAQARYYNSTHGRYTSIDPLTASASIRNPQTFNRYSYVLNSPYKYTDPLGLLPMGWRDSTGGCGAEYSSCSDNWGSSTWDDEDVPEQEETEEGVAEDQQTEGGDQQQAEESTPPPTPSAEQNAEPQSNVTPGTINIGLVEVFDQVPRGGEPIRDTGFRTPETKPVGTVMPDDGEVTITNPPAGDVFYVRLTATMSGDATFAGANLPTVAKNSTNNNFEQTTLPGEKAQPGTTGLKPATKLSDDGRTLTVIIAIARGDSTSSASTRSTTFTVGIYGKSTQGLAESLLVRRPSDPSAKLKINITQIIPRDLP
ncbi:MAG: RHS repeat-associated core domain-containing protein [Acidobacteriota bacterium]|nr:MAG: RHS repeat-associated core domain-containing protein [Acidobacteriota bacterium]